MATEQRVQVLEMQQDPKAAGLFSLHLHKQSPVNLQRQIANTEQQSGRDDVALVLHTSGTTKKPKIAARTNSDQFRSPRSVLQVLECACVRCH